jgi:hypothetical protein
MKPAAFVWSTKLTPVSTDVDFTDLDLNADQLNLGHGSRTVQGRRVMSDATCADDSSAQSESQRVQVDGRSATVRRWRHLRPVARALALQGKSTQVGAVARRYLEGGATEGCVGGPGDGPLSV